MNEREILLSWGTITFEVLLCVLVYARRLNRRLPFFALYVTVFTAGSLIVVLTYHFAGFRSLTSYHTYWTAEGIDVIARGFVVAELCWYRLRDYQGIWKFAKGALILLALGFVGHAAKDALSGPNRLVISSLTFERDINIASVIILLLLLMVRSYYGLDLEPLHREIAAGICFVSLVEIVNNTMARNMLTGTLYPWYLNKHMYLWSSLQPAVDRVHDWWGTVRVVAFMIAMTIWCFALRKPLPEPEAAPALLPEGVYHDISGAVNLRLRAFNDRLVGMLKT